MFGAYMICKNILPHICEHQISVLHIFSFSLFLYLYIHTHLLDSLLIWRLFIEMPFSSIVQQHNKIQLKDIISGLTVISKTESSKILSKNGEIHFPISTIDASLSFHLSLSTLFFIIHSRCI